MEDKMFDLGLDEVLPYYCDYLARYSKWTFDFMMMMKK